jgi:hypothetical protein
MTVHSQDVEMNNRYYFVTRLNGQDMLKQSGLVFTPDISINNQWIVPEDPSVPLSIYKVGDSIKLIWFAKLPDNYSYSIKSLYYLKQGITNRLYIDPTRFSFRKHLELTIHDDDVLARIKSLIFKAFPNSNENAPILVGLNDQIKVLEDALDEVNDEELIETYRAKNSDEKQRMWEDDVEKHRQALEEEMNRVGVTYYNFVKSRGIPNMSQLDLIVPELLPVVYQKYSVRTYFRTKVYDVDFDDMETKHNDQTHQVLDRRFWFEFSLAFPNNIEAEYVKNHIGGDSDKAIHDKLLEASTYFGRRNLILI